MAPDQKVFSRGIHHGLPDLSDAPTDLTAIVTGANGISGSHMMRVLAQDTRRWKKIYALSRSPPSGELPSTVEHIHLDFLDPVDQVRAVLKQRDIKPDFVFWFAYVLVTDNRGALQWGDGRLVERNNLILSNFLEALRLASALPKRFCIQYGQKWYGVHLGVTDVPDEEDDPRLDRESNLYYTQHDILTAFCEKHKVGWNAGLPSFVIGASPDSFQSLLFPILVYASVQKARGQKLEYPADVVAWRAPVSMSNAVLNSYLYEWAVLSPKTANHMFNASDDCAFTWGKLWPKLAAKLDMPYTGPQEPAEHSFSFVEWAKHPANVEVWRKLTEEHQLRDSSKAWADVGSVFGRADFALSRRYPSVMSTSKAKKFGFFGFVDSYESILAVVDEFVGMRMIPDFMMLRSSH